MSEINHSTRGHSPWGASSSHRWMNCTGSIKLIKDNQDKIVNSDSAYSREGTAAHELAEFCIMNDTKAEEMIGREFNEVKVTEEMAQAVQLYLDTIESYVAKLGENCEVLIEESFSLDISDEMFGTNDCCIIAPFDKLVVLDYKHGQGVAVDAVGNTQLMYYALGLYEQYEVEEIELVIVQPRAQHDKGPVRSWTISVKELEDFGKELEKAYKESKSGKGKLVPSEKACRFCPASGFCPALTSKAMEVAKADFSAKEVVLPNPADLSITDISKVLEASKLISMWVKDVESYAHSLAEKGTKVDGYKLVAKRANRKWTDEAKVVETLSEIFDNEDLFDAPKLKSPAQLEKLVGKDNISSLTTVPESGTVLVPIQDKRKEIKPSAIADFTKV